MEWLLYSRRRGCIWENRLYFRAIVGLESQRLNLANRSCSRLLSFNNTPDSFWQATTEWGFQTSSRVAWLTKNQEFQRLFKKCPNHWFNASHQKLIRNLEKFELSHPQTSRCTELLWFSRFDLLEFEPHNLLEKKQRFQSGYCSAARSLYQS